MLQYILQEGEQTGNNAKITSTWIGVKWAFLYLIWSHRNTVVFKGEKEILLILSLSFKEKCSSGLRE